MSKLSIVSGKEVIKALAKIGYYVRGQTGSHIHLRNPEKQAITIPKHNEIARGTLRTIIKQAGLTVEEFNELLDVAKNETGASLIYLRPFRLQE